MHIALGWMGRGVVTLGTLLSLPACESDAGSTPVRNGMGGSTARPDTYVEPMSCFEMEGNEAGVVLAWMRDDGPSVCQPDDDTRDATLVWQAPKTGRYVIRADGGFSGINSPKPYSDGSASIGETAGSPTLTVRPGDCSTMEEPTCSSTIDYEDSSSENVPVWAEEGDFITITAEWGGDLFLSEDDEEFPYAASLRVEELECGEHELPQPPDSHTEIWASGSASPIGPVSCFEHEFRTASEESFVFVAEEAGEYRALFHSDVPMAFARFEANCREELECAVGDDDGNAQFKFSAEAGEEFVFVSSMANSPGEAYSIIVDVHPEWEFSDLP